MNKLFMTLILLLGLQAIASANEVTVNCRTPSMLAGGASITLSGKLKIVISPTTGMTKIKEGSYLTVVKSMRSGAKRATLEEKILVSGTYYPYPASAKRIAANQEPSREDKDDRTYSEITVDGNNSSIFEIKGNQRHPLSCASL